MTIIQVNDTQRIKLSSYAWMVQQLNPGGKKDGSPPQPKWETAAWFPKLSMCCEFLVEKHVAAADLIDAREVVKEIRKSTAAIVQAINNGVVYESWFDQQRKTRNERQS